MLGVQIRMLHSGRIPARPQDVEGVDITLQHSTDSSCKVLPALKKKTLKRTFGANYHPPRILQGIKKDLCFTVLPCLRTYSIANDFLFLGLTSPENLVR